jgi:hypothetical protein
MLDLGLGRPVNRIQQDGNSFHVKILSQLGACIVPVTERRLHRCAKRSPPPHLRTPLEGKPLPADRLFPPPVAAPSFRLNRLCHSLLLWSQSFRNAPKQSFVAFARSARSAPWFG